MADRGLTEEQIEFVVEALRGAQSEISAMETTYDDYVSSGDLLEQLEEAIEIMEGIQ